MTTPNFIELIHVFNEGNNLHEKALYRKGGENHYYLYGVDGGILSQYIEHDNPNYKNECWGYWQSPDAKLGVSGLQFSLELLNALECNKLELFIRNYQDEI